MNQTKKQRKIANLAALRALDRSGLVVEEFNSQCGTHIRVHGPEMLVDYWPSTNRAWPFGSKCKGFLATAAEIFEIARLTW